MNPQNPTGDTASNPGSFMSTAQPGAGSALMQLLQQQQQGTPQPVLNQNTVSPTSVPPAGAIPMPTATTMTPPSPGPQSSPPQAQLAPQDANTQLVLKALQGYLSHAQNMNEAQAGIQK